MFDGLRKAETVMRPKNIIYQNLYLVGFEQSSNANCCFAVRVSSWLKLIVIYSWLNGWPEHGLLASGARGAPTFMKILLHSSLRHLDEGSSRFFRKVGTRVHKHAEKHHFPDDCNLNIQGRENQISHGFICV